MNLYINSNILFTNTPPEHCSTHYEVIQLYNWNPFFTLLKTIFTYTSQMFKEVCGKEMEEVKDELLKYNAGVLKELGEELEEVKNKLNIEVLDPYELSLSAYKKQMDDALTQIKEVKERARNLISYRKELVLNYLYATAEYKILLKIKYKKQHKDYKRYKHNYISKLEKVNRELIKNYKEYEEKVKQISATEIQKASVLELSLKNIGNLFIDTGKSLINKSTKLLPSKIIKHQRTECPSFSLKEYKIDEWKVTSKKPKGKLNEKTFTFIFNRVFNKLKEGKVSTQEEKEYILRALRHSYALKIFIESLSKITSPTQINSLDAFNELSELIRSLLTSLLDNKNEDIGKEIVVVLLSCKYLVITVNNILIIGERSMYE